MSSSETTTVSQNNHSFYEIKEDIYRRDSFDDRFCDDLSEVILQFLPLKDKLRLECVSKQFQRTVFQKLYELNLDDSELLVVPILDTLAKKFQRLDCIQKLESISIALIDLDLRQLLPALKAFPALKRLKLWTDIPEWDNYFEIHGWFDFSRLFSFELFEGLSNITHLTLDVSLCECSAETLNERFLEHIDTFLPDLQYLEICDIFETIFGEEEGVAETLSRLSRLETLKLRFISGADFKPFEDKIIEKCEKIKEIEIESYSDNPYLNFEYYEQEYIYDPDDNYDSDSE